MCFNLESWKLFAINVGNVVVGLGFSLALVVDVGFVLLILYYCWSLDILVCCAHGRRKAPTYTKKQTEAGVQGHVCTACGGMWVLYVICIVCSINIVISKIAMCVSNAMTQEKGKRRLNKLDIEVLHNGSFVCTCRAQKSLLGIKGSEFIRVHEAYWERCTPIAGSAMKGKGKAVLARPGCSESAYFFHLLRYFLRNDTQKTPTQKLAF